LPSKIWQTIGDALIHVSFDVLCSWFLISSTHNKSDTGSLVLVSCPYKGDAGSLVLVSCP
jgi:hypothetical protein